MSIHDTYRVVITGQDGLDSPGNLWSREIALGVFAAVLQSANPLPRRVRVISEKTWLESGGPR